MTYLNNFYLRLRHYFSDKYPRIYQICERYKSIIKFIISGGTAAAVNLVLLFIFHGLLGLELLFSTSAAYILSFFVSFVLQKFWTFRDKRRGKTGYQFCIYILNTIFGLSLNGLFMHLLVDNLSVWYLLAQVISSAVIAIWNFIIFKTIIFRIHIKK